MDDSSEMEIDSESLLHNLQINLPNIVYIFIIYYLLYYYLLFLGFNSYLYTSFNIQST